MAVAGLASIIFLNNEILNSEAFTLSRETKFSELFSSPISTSTSSHTLFQSPSLSSSSNRPSSKLPLYDGSYSSQSSMSTMMTQMKMSVSPIEDTDTSSSTNTGRTRAEIEAEVSSGRVLDDGPVVDFSSVKDESSNAERALLRAREEYVNGSNTVSASHGLNGKGQRLVGINNEVVKEVGREVGAFINPNDALIQECATYLRSKAPVGLFQAPPDNHIATHALSSFSSSLSPSTTQTTTNPSTAKLTPEIQNLLQEAYEESGLVTEAFAKTFYLGTQLLPEEARRAIWAIYVWCRRTDEIVDAPRSESDPPMLSDLSAWEIRLENLFQYGMVEDVLDLPLLDVKINYPNLPIQPFVDMIRGMLMDIPDLGQERYETFEELHLYCYRVAGTVGLMSMPIFGCANGYTEEDAKEPALSLGVAFQITNILRDVGEDATKRGRIYLPRKDMEKFGVTEEQIMSQRIDENYIALMKHEIKRARMYYDRALRGVPMLSPAARLPVQSSLDCYGKILDKIEEQNYDSLNYRAYCTKWEKLAEIPFSWYRTQDISKTLPLPWDAVQK